MSTSTPKAGASPLPSGMALIRASEVVPVGTMATARARRPQRVLTEEAYVAGIDRIVQRDYFPDLPALREQTEWTQAVQAGNVEAQAAVRARQRQRMRSVTPARQETPLGRFGDTPVPAATPSVDGDDHGARRAAADTGVPAGRALDAFLAHNTSEDNEAFEQLQEVTQKRLQERIERHGKSHRQLALEDKARIEAKPKPALALEDGALQDGDERPSSVDGWAHAPKNALMWFPDGGTLAQKASEPARTVVPQNTRLSTQVAVAMAASRPARVSDTAATDGDPLATLLASNRLLNAVPRVRGYDFVSTPRLDPEKASPFVTWGNVMGTPVRHGDDESAEGEGGMDAEEAAALLELRAAMAPGAAPGVDFHVPAVPAREAAAHRLLEDGKKRAVHDRRRMRGRHRRTPGTPGTPRTPGSVDAGAWGLTPTPGGGRRWRSTKASPIGADPYLRASYASPRVSTPGRSRGTTPRDGFQTPRTPSSVRRPRPTSSTHSGHNPTATKKKKQQSKG